MNIFGLALVVAVLAAASGWSRSPVDASESTPDASRGVLAAGRSTAASPLQVPSATRTATMTATPRFPLPASRTPAPPIAVGTAADSRLTIEAAASPGAAGTAGAATARAPGGVAEDGARGSPPTAGTGASGSGATEAIAPAALPGGGTGSGGASSGETGARGAGAGETGTGGAALVTTPREGSEGGGVRPPVALLAPVTDPVVERMWQTYGSPQAGRPPLERLTAGRPGPWGLAPWYLVIAAGFGWVLWTVVRDLARWSASRGDRARVARESGGDTQEA